jgi:hypothetical protein
MSRDAAAESGPTRRSATAIPSPAQLARRRPTQPPSRTHVPAPRTKFRPLLGRHPGELLHELGVPVDDLQSRLAQIVGGEDVWADLENAARRGQIVGRAWKSCLDFVEDTSRADDAGFDLNHALLAVMLHVHAAFGAPGTVVTRSLNQYGLGWLGTWRELNIRLGDKLFRHAGSGSRRSDPQPAIVALRAALQCWEVVEILSGRDTDDQRRRWRGMRGVTHLSFVRRGEHAHTHLPDAIGDLEIAESCGDRTPQHFALLAEAYLRAHLLAGDDRMLNQADDTLRRARGSTPNNAELAAGTGDLHRLRGLRALSVAGVPVPRWEPARSATDRHGRDSGLESGLDDIDAFETTGFCAEALVYPGAEPALTAARGAFVAAIAWYDHAIGLAPAGRTEQRTMRIRRGQARMRLAQVRCLLGRPYRDELEAALPDLRLCHAGVGAICADYLPWALFEYARVLLRDVGHPAGLASTRPAATAASSAASSAAASAADEALAFMSKRLPAGHVLNGKLSELRATT